jgi:uncharacterized ubiquitin-like protein YukD
MSEIKVSLITMDGIEREIETPSDITVKDFISELVMALSLPYTDAEGTPLSWRIDNKDTGKTLFEDQTLEQNGVFSGHRLSLIRNTIAGGLKLNESSTSEDVLHSITAENIFHNFIFRDKRYVESIGSESLIIPRLMLPILKEYIEGNAISKWLNRFIGFFLGTCLSLSAPLLMNNPSSYIQGAFLGALLISVVALFILIILARKYDYVRRKEASALTNDLSSAQTSTKDFTSNEQQ